MSIWMSWEKSWTWRILDEMNSAVKLMEYILLLKFSVYFQQDFFFFSKMHYSKCTRVYEQYNSKLSFSNGVYHRKLFAVCQFFDMKLIACSFGTVSIKYTKMKTPKQRWCCSGSSWLAAITNNFDEYLDKQLIFHR